MPERAPMNRARVGYALLASAAAFLVAAIVVASGAIGVPAPARRLATIVLSAGAAADAVLALVFLMKASSQP